MREKEQRGSSTDPGRALCQGFPREEKKRNEPNLPGAIGKDLINSAFHVIVGEDVQGLLNAAGPLEVLVDGGEERGLNLSLSTAEEDEL